MRKLIGAFKISIDGKSEGPDGYADWVHSWAEEYGLTEQIDACVLGGGMYPGYEQYWTATLGASGETLAEPLPITGQRATAAEERWARFAAKTPHYVVSSTLSSARWSNTSFLRSLDEVAALKAQPGKSIYLMGGARLAASLADAGLIDELRLIVYPLIAGPGKALFGTSGSRSALELRDVERMEDGRVLLTYAKA